MLESVQVLRRLLVAFVLLQTPDQLGPGIFRLLFLAHRPWQQHAGFDLCQHRSHHQIFRRQFQAQIGHHLDVLDVLIGDLGDRDIQNIQILAFDQIEQQVQRSLEGIEKHLQGIRWNVEIGGWGGKRLPLNPGEGQLFLLRMMMWMG